MKKILRVLIRVYQLTMANFVGNCCRFYPTCSEYALEALEKKRLHTALFLIIKRLGRCHPFSKGGPDFVP